jgi:hypothetical protein
MTPPLRSLARARRESGSAVVVALLSTSVVLTLALMLALTTTLETDIAANAHAAVQTLALAEAAAERASAELGAMASWDDVLSGAVTSAFYDGSHGMRQAAGTTIDLDSETTWLLCGSPSCTGTSWNAVTAVRPWGNNNPRWTVFASGTAATLLGTGARALPGYTVVWVGDDAAENDADALHDGGAPVAEAGNLENPGLGVLGLRTVAWGARGSRRELEWVVERADLATRAGIRVRVWREVRGPAP